jgi:orotidine-5'-phosphate decarboxylase
MRGKTHERIALSAAGLAVYAASVNPAMGAEFVAGAYVAAKTPDLDLVIPGLPHRGPLSHGPFYVLPLAAGVLWNVAALGPAAAMFALGVYLGLAAHLAADGCTVHGIPGRPVCKRIWLVPERMRSRTR